MRWGQWSATVFGLIAAWTVAAETVPMAESGRATFQVEVAVHGWSTEAFLVDTGSSYMTLPAAAMASLNERGQAVYVRDLVGHMADGTRHVVPVYRVETITIGGVCTLRDVEAAVLPGTDRPILGLSALRDAAPFRFSLSPPTLELDGCGTAPAIAAGD